MSNYLENLIARVSNHVEQHVTKHGFLDCYVLLTVDDTGRDSIVEFPLISDRAITSKHSDRELFEGLLWELEDEFRRDKITAYSIAYPAAVRNVIFDSVIQREPRVYSSTGVAIEAYDVNEGLFSGRQVLQEKGLWLALEPLDAFMPANPQCRFGGLLAATA
jgi:hypothetical protein